MVARPSLVGLAVFLAVGVLLGDLGGCRTTEIGERLPGRRDEMGRTIHPLAPDHGGTFRVDTGSIPGPLVGPSERVHADLRVAVRSDSDLKGSAPTEAVEEYRPSALPIGRVRWPTGEAGPDGGISGDVLVEWMIGLRERGSCAVDVDLVPRLTPSCGDPVLLESMRIHRTIAVGDSLVLVSDPAGPSVPTGTSRPTGLSGRVGGLLVGAPPGRVGRFVIRVRG